MPPSKLPAVKEAKRSAAEFLPPKPTLKKLKEAARACQGCDLYKHASQTVFGEGSAKARVLFVGEQPGDLEDKAGKPFVGPAGKLLDRALQEAGIDRSDTYVTNAVKHFKFELRGKKRIHDKPRQLEITACLPWLLAEIEQIKPDVIVCLGATAAQALIGKTFKITRERGRFLPSTHAPHIMATVHPSAVLRARDDQSRHREYELFLRDLKLLKSLLDK